MRFITVSLASVADDVAAQHNIVSRQGRGDRSTHVDLSTKLRNSASLFSSAQMIKSKKFSKSIRPQLDSNSPPDQVPAPIQPQRVFCPSSELVHSIPQ
jgi:hypothetical protein